MADPSNYFTVMPYQNDAGNFRVSTVGGLLSVSAAVSSDDAGLFHVSALNQDANFMHTSGFSPDASLFRTSSIQGDANLQHTSAFVDSGSISARQSDANNLHASAVQGDAGLFRVSSFANNNTTGQLTMFYNLNVSSSVNAKSTAGAIYGWHAWNSDTKPNYIKFTNTSGAQAVGTDAVIHTISLAASGRSDQSFPMGLKGFTAGIGVYSVSVNLDTATTPGTASAVGIDLYYI